MISVTTELGVEEHKRGNVYRNQTKLVGGFKAPLSWFALCQSNQRKREETKQTGTRQRGINITASYASGAENRRRPKEKEKLLKPKLPKVRFFRV